MQNPAQGRELVLSGVEVSFGGLKAIGGVDLTVSPGEFVGIVGPNGAGKSTLIQTITGFARPSAGTISLGGRRLDGSEPEDIAALGIARTFQTSRVFPALTIGESVRVGTQRGLIGGGRTPKRFGCLAEPIGGLFGIAGYGKAAREADARAEEILKLFGERLWPRRDRPTHSLSYANRRRLDIARALATSPDLLLLDEPTAGMNPTESHELADLLLDVRRRFPAMTIVMVEHKLDIVRKLTQRTIVMAQGKVLVDADPDRAFADPQVAAAYLGQGGGRIHAVVRGHLDHEPEAPMPGPPDTPAIELNNVDVFYGPVQALFGVSLKVGRGEAVAVLGGNASGKSTTIKTVLRLVTPRSGEISLYGQPLKARTTADVIEQGIASIPEGRRMFAELTVRDNILIGAYARRGTPRVRLDRDIEAAVAEFPWLRDRLDQLAGTLSGGEQQMVAMARAWLRKPLVLCIDEPSMGLSPLMVDRVYDILTRWKSQGLTIVMVEQSANKALELVDRAYVLRNGVVSMEGSAAELRENPGIREAYLGGEHAPAPGIITAGLEPASLH
ncbi:ATP-binding cassette domain-containing protein [Bosea sp. SSUT16]|uniref:ATP-binding cassette domain-containing protein n=1 Tax=Bosea spartocytisi TaxID=2773451 RepID=A0A927I007_9HYPH|nr:ATP-binding cassette domain-containing protein [Bosea spartocytisi]MBD3848155.1 ATP-binding cassette domain-containing protein [Bosea spartocytisi]MCT4474005.1 ATP-binding cassette domain-containing protein [Bosea spartocytisi]